jgi:stage II sporulation protein E
VLFVLYAGRFGGISAGAVAGIAAGAVMGLSTVGITPLSGAYALGGLMAGIFSPLGKLASALAFVLSNAAASLQIGMAQSMPGLYEAAIASILFVAIPGGGRVAALFSSPSDNLRSSGLRESMVMRLQCASGALSSVSDAVEDISRKLTLLSAPDMSGVYKKAAEKTCHGCGLRPYCWEREYHETVESLEGLTEVLRREGKVDRRECTPYLRDHCARLPELLQSINGCYQEFLARDAAELRARQVREVVAGQFDMTAHLLRDMAEETEQYDRFDYNMAQKTGEILREAGVLPLEVCCRVDSFGRMTVEAETARGDRQRLNKSALTREISRASGRDFGPPGVSMVGDHCRMVLTERPALRARFGAAQHICGGGSLCGDSYSSFTDGSGRQMAVISDGMGTGGRAAVDGAMAAGIVETLLKSGIGYQCALQIVNSALLAKSGEETLATLDVLCLDLFTGKACFYKAGAPVSFVRKNGRGVEVEAPSLPVGILGEAEFARAEIDLADGDLIALVSDGVTAGGSEWICGELEEWPGGDPQTLAERLVARAREQRSDGHDDDITALVLLIENRRVRSEGIPA